MKRLDQLFLFAIFVFTFLVCNPAGCLASRLARSLAFSAASGSYTVLQVARFNCYDPFHNMSHPLSYKIHRINLAFFIPVVNALLPYIKKRFLSRIDCNLAELVFNPEELVVFSYSVASGRRARLYLTGIDRHRNIGDSRILRFAGAV